MVSDLCDCHREQGADDSTKGGYRNGDPILVVCATCLFPSVQTRERNMRAHTRTITSCTYASTHDDYKVVSVGSQ